MKRTRILTNFDIDSYSVLRMLKSSGRRRKVYLLDIEEVDELSDLVKAA